MSLFKDRITEVRMLGRKESEKLRGELKCNQILNQKRLDKIRTLTLQILSDLSIENVLEAKTRCEEIIAFLAR
jgi:hypothetical protein